jgi:hypothetical protein
MLVCLHKSYTVRLRAKITALKINVFVIFRRLETYMFHILSQFSGFKFLKCFWSWSHPQCALLVQCLSAALLMALTHAINHSPAWRQLVLKLRIWPRVTFCEQSSYVLIKFQCVKFKWENGGVTKEGCWAFSFLNLKLVHGGRGNKKRF